MADIELVIKIDEEDYKKVLESNNRNYEWNDMCACYEAVFKGTSLPKGHGNLVDTNELRENGVATESYLNTFIKTIIKADKEN